MGRAAGECLDALFLVHTESRAHQRAVVIIVDIEHSAVAVEEFAHVAGEIHHGAVLDGGDRHLFDIFYRKVDVCPVLAVIGMAVKVDLIALVIVARGIVHQHDIVVLQIFAHEFLIE